MRKQRFTQREIKYALTWFRTNWQGGGSKSWIKLMCFFIGRDISELREMTVIANDQFTPEEILELKPLCN